MIKVKVNNEYKDVVKIFCGGTLQKEITKVWSREAQEYVYESSVEYTGTLPITINANGDALIDYRIYGIQGGIGEVTENLWNNYFVNGTYEPGGFRPNSFHICGVEKIPIKASTRYSIGYVSTYPYPIDRHYLYEFDTQGERLRQISFAGSSVTTSSDAAFCTISVGSTTVGIKPDDILDFMLVEGSTAPANYIPYGYKLPMTVYKQEFTVTNDMLNQSNWILSPPHGGYDLSYFIYFDISDFISKEECSAKVCENFTDGYVPQLLVCALTDKMYETVSTEYRILTNDGVILNKEFDFASWDKIYLCIGYGNGFTNERGKQLKIDELFGNWKILIAPTSQTREVPVYIGENQLGDGEYVSYGEQKIYRDVGGTLTPTDSPVPLPEIPTIDGETVIDYDGDPKPSQMYCKYRKQYS